MHRRGALVKLTRLPERLALEGRGVNRAFDRVSPRLCEEAERTLRDGETLSSLVVEARERTIELRRLQSEFVERGLAAATEARTQNRYVPAATALRRLRRQVDDARQSRSRRATRGE